MDIGTVLLSGTGQWRAKTCNHIQKKKLSYWDFTIGRQPETCLSQQVLFQSRAILRYVGKIGKYEGKSLYPEDPMEQFLCDEVIEMVEDLHYHWKIAGRTLRVGETQVET